MNRMLENFLRRFCTYQLLNWDELLSAADYAYNSSVVEGTGYSPFELDLGWQPKFSLDVLSSNKSNNDSVETLRCKLSFGAQDAYFAHKVAQAFYISYNQGRYRPLTYRPGDFSGFFASTLPIPSQRISHLGNSASLALDPSVLSTLLAVMPFV